MRRPALCVDVGVAHVRVAPHLPLDALLRDARVQPLLSAPSQLPLLRGVPRADAVMGGDLLPPSVAFFLLGLSLGAALQIHLSWPLLVPFLLTAIVARARAGLLTPRQIGWLLLGAAGPLALLAPT